MKRIIYKNIVYISTLAILLCFSLPAIGQDKPIKKFEIETISPIDTLDIDSLPDSYIDTVKIKKKFIINDYSLIGFEYGVNMNKMTFNPVKKHTTLINPVHFGLTYTKYCKMFGYMPYFGIQTGIMYSKEGYKFEKDKETGESQEIAGANQATISIIEVPVLAQFHMDFWKMKMMASIGFYGGYRLDIERVGENVAPEIRNDFTDTDRRFEYGLKGGVGVGFIFDPIEVHIQGMVRYSWSSLYEPDYMSKYYYQFAYPLDFVISAGIHYQLNKRQGNTRRQLKKRAQEIVYGQPR